MNVIPFNINPNAKEPADKDKPRRPLSAYNLFFRFKRQKILEACEESDINRETVESIVSCKPGLENVSHDAVPDLDEEELGKFRSDRIRAELGDKLTPKEADEAKARAHRKTQFKHGLSFLEMTKIISSSWKECDDISKKIFQTLAEDGRNIRQQLLEDYTKAREEKSDSSSGSCNKQAMLAKSFDKVRPNAIHKPAAARKMKAASQSVERVDEEISAETHVANMNTNQKAMDYIQRIYGQRPSQPTMSAATAAAAMASLHQANPASAAAGLARPLETTYPLEQSLLNPLKNNPYLPPSYQKSLLLSAHASRSERNPFSTTSAADKLKMVQLEAANESMKKMLEKLVTVNADLEGQNTNLTQLVGQLTAENCTLKRSIAVGGQLTTNTPSILVTRNIGAVTPSAPIHYHALSQGLGFPPGPPAPARSIESDESLPQQTNTKRPRVLADPWSRPGR